MIVGVVRRRRTWEILLDLSFLLSARGRDLCLQMLLLRMERMNRSVDGSGHSLSSQLSISTLDLIGRRARPLLWPAFS